MLVTITFPCSYVLEENVHIKRTRNEGGDRLRERLTLRLDLRGARRPPPEWGGGEYDLERPLRLGEERRRSGDTDLLLLARRPRSDPTRSLEPR